jgi:AraC family transcriptional regulator
MTPERLNRIEYEKRINRVMDYIAGHLAEELPLERLAQVAAFSPFHFHRVFKAIAGENLFEFIRRVRVERAGALLLLDGATSITGVALDTGFSSPAVFARAFKGHFGLSASAWRRQREAERNAGKPKSKGCKAPEGAARHSLGHARVETRNHPAFHLAYMRHIGPYGQAEISEAWNQFARWMQAHELLSEDTVTLGIPHDHPGVTAPSRCRYDCGVVVPAGFQKDRLVNLTDLPAGKYAVLPFRGTASELVQAWEALFESWLPESGYQPDNRPFYELHRGLSRRGADGLLTCQICLPITPL